MPARIMEQGVSDFSAKTKKLERKKARKAKGKDKKGLPLSQPPNSSTSKKLKRKRTRKNEDADNEERFAIKAPKNPKLESTDALECFTNGGTNYNETQQNNVQTIDDPCLGDNVMEGPVISLTNTPKSNCDENGDFTVTAADKDAANTNTVSSSDQEKSEEANDNNIFFFDNKGDDGWEKPKTASKPQGNGGSAKVSDSSTQKATLTKSPTIKRASTKLQGNGGSAKASDNTTRKAMLTKSLSIKRAKGKGKCLTRCASCMEYRMPHLSKSMKKEMRNYVALDCEFVGVGPGGGTNALGRCSLVDCRGKVLLDCFVSPEEEVTDYRTPWSGLRAHHIKQGLPLVAVTQRVASLLKGKIVVGHAVHNDFKVLGVPHPWNDVRDTSRCRELADMANLAPRQCALRRLTHALLGRTIQDGEHCSVTDSRATMDLFRLVRTSWEPDLLAKANRRSEMMTPEPHYPLAKTQIRHFLNDKYWPSDMLVNSY